VGAPLVNPQTDPVLLPFLSAPDEEEAHVVLSQLINDVSPTISGITSRGQSADDAFQETMKKLVNRLRALRSHPDGSTIANFDHYVKVVAKHTVSEQLREDHPTYRGLADSLRHALKGDPRFGVWGARSEDIFGLAIWRDQQPPPTRTEKSMRLVEDPAALAEVLPPGFHQLSAVDLLTEIFSRVGQTISLDRLVRLYRALKPVEESITISISEREGSTAIDLPARERKPDEEAEFREFLSNVWREVKELPRDQRIAYLLNFTAGDGQLDMFPAYGVATIRDIGAVLALTGDHFAILWNELKFNEHQRDLCAALKTYDERFALLWQHLPIADNWIARMLGVKRQQVINLRKAAGDRLSRRLAHGRRAAHCRTGWWLAPGLRSFVQVLAVQRFNQFLARGF
jgi:hypothetical protein